MGTVGTGQSNANSAQYGIKYKLTVTTPGPVFQPTFVRENVTDYKLTLHCILGLLQATNGQVISTVYSGFNQAEIVTSMIEELNLKLMNPLEPVLSQKKLWRDKVIFGTAAEVLGGIAQDNGMVWFLTQRNLNQGTTGIVFSTLGNGLDTKPGFVYTPTTGLIGTPVQTDKGVDCSVLLDPRVWMQIPLQTFGIEQALIQQATLQPGQLVKASAIDGNIRGSCSATSWR
jgi:hypothetical protein